MIQVAHLRWKTQCHLGWKTSASGMAQFYAQMPDEVNLTVNGNHPIYKTILAEKGEEKQKSLVKNLGDLALLSQGLLSGKNLTEFINRSVELMEQK